MSARADLEGLISVKVDGIPNDITTEDLQGYFKTFGDVKDVYIPREYHSQANKGYAFVRYENMDEAEKASEKDTVELLGNSCSVMLAEKTKRDRRFFEGREMRGGKGGGRYGRGDRYGGGGYGRSPRGRGRDRSYERRRSVSRGDRRRRGDSRRRERSGERRDRSGGRDRKRRDRSGSRRRSRKDQGSKKRGDSRRK